MHMLVVVAALALAAVTPYLSAPARDSAEAPALEEPEAGEEAPAPTQD